MALVFEPVVKRGEVAGLDAERCRNQPVREPDVLWQHGAVEIGTDDRAGSSSFEPRPAVVAVPLQDPPERFGSGAEQRTPAVIFEASKHALVPGVELDLYRDVADQSLALGSDGREIEQAHALDLLAAKLVVVTEELDAATDPEDYCASSSGRMERLSLRGD